MYQELVNNFKYIQECKKPHWGAAFQKTVNIRDDQKSKDDMALKLDRLFVV
jgi:hypothetical protein